MFDLDTTQNSSHEQSQPVLAEPSPDNGRQKKARGRSVVQTKASARTGARETARARKSWRAPKTPVTAPTKPPAEAAPEKLEEPGKKRTSRRIDKSKRTGKPPAPDDSGAAPGSPDKAADTPAPNGKPAKKSPPWSNEDPLGYVLHLIREELGGAPEKLVVTGGEPIRFPTAEGKDKSGWVRVYQIGKHFLVQYGDWRTGDHHERICPEPGTPREKAKFEQERRRLEETRQRDEQAKHTQAREKAQRLLRTTERAPTNLPYLQRKGVQPHGARAFRRSELLIVPLCDTEWSVWNLQFIQPDGSKVFLTGGRVKGLFHPFGTKEDFGRSKAILVCEGWATGATLHEATGMPVAAAMNCGNLLPVARALKEKYPQQRLVICADDDWKTESAGKGNPGIDKAQKTASVVGAVVAVPVWSGEQRGEKDTDFNDLAKTEGLDAVRRLVDDALQQKARPGEDERPCYWLLEEAAEFDGKLYEAGVYHCGMAKVKVSGREVEAPVETWLSSPIRLEARTTEWPDGCQGVRLSVWDDRAWRGVILPRETLASSRYREILFAVGARLTEKSEPALVGYLQQDTDGREYVTRRAGWHDKHYVLPDATVGAGVTISFVGEKLTDEPLVSGTLSDWQQSVAALAVGNPLLTFSISLAFVGPLLKLTGHDAVLVQLVGRSTTGKTTCLLAANSVVGPPALVTTWRATANGLEQRALAHCDGFLALDEIGQVEPKVLDHAVYALANGAAKQRARVYEQGVGAVPTQRWRVAALSTGEKTMETLLAMDNRSVNAGQAVRFIEIPAEERYGAFTKLHGCQSAAELADKLREAVRRHYGTPLRAFLERFVDDDKDGLGEAVRKTTDALRKAVEKDGTVVSAQSSRVLTSLALVAVAGELASQYKVTGWTQRVAFDAARYCYRLWAQSRPTQTDFEQVVLLRQLRDFITRDGTARFSSVSDGYERAVNERAGYYRDAGDDCEYLFTNDGLRRAVFGFDFQRARQELARLGVLAVSNGRDSQVLRIGCFVVRVHVVSFNALNRALERIGGAE